MTAPTPPKSDYIAGDTVTPGAMNLIADNIAYNLTQLSGKQAQNTNLASISSLVDPNADRLMFWDDSAGAWTHLTPGTNLSITGTTLNAAGATGYAPGGTDVAIADGGTGVSTLPSAILKGAGTGPITGAAQGTDYYAPAGTDVALIDGGTGASLVDPNADRILFWDDSASTMTWLTLGANLSITGTTINASGSTGYAPGGTDVALADGGTGATLTAPGTDQIMFYDVSAGSTAYLTPGTNLSITGTTINSTGGGGYAPGGTDVALADGGTGATLADPNADRIMFWDDSAGAVTWLTPGSGLTITGTSITASGGGGGSGEYINVKRDYGATGNGSTDDATAIQNALTAAGAAGGGLVYVPPGVYRLNTTLTIPANVELRGAGEEATQLTKFNNHIMLDISGTATGWANHTRFQRVCDMTLIGENTTGALIRSYYADNMRFDNLLLSYNNDKGFDLVEVYDSFFNAVTADTVSGSDGTKPTVHIRCSAAASGFGFGADDSNMLWFVNCHFENYGDGAIWIEAGQGSSTPNGIWFTHLKCESSNMAGGPVIKVGPTVMNCHFKDVYMYGNGFLSGFGTPIPAIVASGTTLTTYRDMWIAGGPTSSFSNAIEYTGNGGGQHVFEGIRWNGGGAALTGSVLNFMGGTADVEVGAITANDSSTLFGGTPPNQFTGTRPLRRVAGAVSDASFLKPPLPGTMALDTTNNRLYIRAGSTWRYAALT